MRCGVLFDVIASARPDRRNEGEVNMRRDLRRRRRATTIIATDHSGCRLRLSVGTRALIKSASTVVPV